MKKILISLVLIALMLSVKGQYLNRQPIGSINTENYAVGSYGTTIGLRFITSFADTTAANNFVTVNIKAIPGFVIRVVSTLWIRNNAATQWVEIGSGGGGGSGTVTSVSVGNLSPLFTSSVATATTTPAITFSLSNAAGGTVFGNNGSSSAAPAFTAVPVLGIAGTTQGTLGFAGLTSGVITVKGAAAAGTYNWIYPQTAGTSGYLLTSGGGGSTAMTWTDPSSYTQSWQGTLNVSSVLTTDNLIEDNSAGAHGLSFGKITAFNSIQMYAGTIEHVGSTHLLLQSNAKMTLQTVDSLLITGLTNLTTQDRLLGIRNSNGRVGTITLGSGISLASGVLSATGTGGTLTNITWTGGIVSIANPTTTPAFTIAGTSGGGVYFSSTSAWASTGLLAANALMIGGGAGTAYSTTTTGTGILTWLGTPSSANLRGALTDENGTGVALFDAATTPTFTTGFQIGGAAASRKMIVGNGTNFVPSTETWAVPGTSGNILTSDGTNWTSAAPATSGTVTGTGVAGRSTYWSGTSSITSSANYLYTDAPTTGNGLAVTNSAGTTGNLVAFTNTGTAAASNTKNVLALASSGANANASQTVTGQTINVDNSGTTATNVGLNISLSNGTAALNKSIITNADATINTVRIGLGNASVVSNTALGNLALNAITTAQYSTGVGQGALAVHRVGNFNTAVGYVALVADTSGYQNTAIGSQTLSANLSGYRNTAVGDGALYANTTGFNNTAIGAETLINNTTGSYNSAFGRYALISCTIGTANTGTGAHSLELLTQGVGNTANGYYALVNVTTGSNNTAIGHFTAQGITTGSGNTILGANVPGLAATLTNHIMIANGTGAVKATHDATNWTLVGSVIGDATVGVFNTVSTTVNAFGAATTLNIGAGSTQILNFGGHTSAAEFRFLEPSGAGTNYVGFKSPATLAGNTTYLLPNAYPAVTGYVLSSTDAGVMSWVSAGGGLTIGTTTITSGTDTRILYDNAGVVGEYTITGTGTVVAMQTSPSITTSLVTGSTTFALLNTTATTVNAFGATTALNIGAAAATILNFGGHTTASEFRYLEPSGSGTNYSAFKAVAQGASITYSLPPTVGAAGTFLSDVAGDGVLTWEAAAGGAPTWNAITDPTGDQALSFGAGESSTWTDANTTEDLFTANSSTGTTNSMFSFNRTGTALAAGNNIMELISSGATATNAITNSGLVISVTNTNATSGTNTALTLTASGATTANYALIATGLSGFGTTAPVTQIHAINITANTNTVQNVLTLSANSSGTAAASFGTGILFQGESTTTDNRDMANIQASWSTATDASRVSQLRFQTLTGAGALTTAMTLSGTGTMVVPSNITSTSGSIIAGNVLTAGSQFNMRGDGNTNTYKLTNAGGTVSSFVSTNTGNSSAGVLNVNMDNTNMLTFSHGNGSAQIAGSAIKITNLDNTAGSEDNDMAFFTQAAGATPVERFRITNLGGFVVNATNTTAGTTGDQTINKPSGTVNVAAAGTSVTVTNSLVTAASLVFCVIRTNDGTATLKNVVPGAGSFVVTLTAAATSEVSIGFLVIN